MEYKRYLLAMWKWSWLIVLAAGLAGYLSYRASMGSPRIYQTTTTVVVGQFLKTANPNSQDFSVSQQLAQSYAQLARSQPILEATASSLSLGVPWGSLVGSVNAGANNDLIRITVADTNPRRAKAVADEIARQLIIQSPTPQGTDIEQHRQFVSQQIADLQAKIVQAQKQVAERQQDMEAESSARAVQDIQSQIDALQQKINGWQRNYTDLLGFYTGSRTNYLAVLEPASVPTAPVSPNVPLNVLLAATIGALLAVGAAFLMEYLDDTLRTAEDVDRMLGLPAMASIARLGRIGKPTESLVNLRAPDSAVAEAYRVLRTNVQFACVDEASPVLLVTSAGPREGKSVTAANLAVSFAQAGRRTILVEADLRHPTICTLFGVPKDYGLTSLFLDEAGRRRDRQAREVAGVELGTGEADGELRRRLDDYLVPTVLSGLQLLPGGPILPANPAELLASAKMEQLLRVLRDAADVVILDCPPMLPLADTGILAAKVTGVVLVVEAGKTRTPAVRLAAEALSRARARVLGIVLNKARRDDVAYHYYHRKAAEPPRQPGYDAALARD